MFGNICDSRMKKAYIILAPSWTEISSGPRALHLLAHELNNTGQDAYIFPENSQGFALNPNLNTKLLKPEYANYYRENIIAVYPDVTRGNPLNSRHVVRWLLAPAGQYGGDKEFLESDHIWCFRQDIAEQQKTDKILCLPTFKPHIFFDNNSPRSGTCFYAHKYDRIHGNSLLPITENSLRLEGTPEYIASILQRSEKCYLYEPSEIKVHSAMAGCPVEEVITPYFQGMGEQPDFFLYGKVRTPEDMYSRFKGQLNRFIEQTQCTNS